MLNDNNLVPMQYVESHVESQVEKGYNKGTHRNIHDASWSKFIFMLSYKSESAGRKLIKVDPRNTTQRCFACLHCEERVIGQIS
ncbi:MULTISPECIES: zinc ribbon domain-containing protein [Methanothrix]|uniref:zinc ribbon domain-containing protein n=1 Tax=Methanothrix sp. TaxID=90426 RepID=UPI002E102A66